MLQTLPQPTPLPARPPDRRCWTHLVPAPLRQLWPSLASGLIGLLLLASPAPAQDIAAQTRAAQNLAVAPNGEAPQSTASVSIALQDPATPSAPAGEDGSDAALIPPPTASLDRVEQPQPEPRGIAVATAVRLSGDAGHTRLAIDLTRAVPLHVFTLTDPARVILDLADTAFAVDAAAAPQGRGLVTTYRFGAFAPGKARMVLELSGPAAVENATVEAAADGRPASLVLDLAASDAESFARSVVASASARTAALPASPPPPPRAAGDTRPVIVLDPGHGGIDSGTTGYSAFTEKTIVLETALAVRDRLEATGAYKVVLTRTADTFIPLADRVRIARASRADLFISLHADALARGDGRARGASVYTLSDTATDAEAAHLADKENKADLIAGLDLSEETDAVADILVDLAQRETRHFSALFAHTLVGAMKNAVRTHRSGLKSAGFRVLKAHDVPSVLVELGYMSSAEDLKLLTSEAWRGKVSDAIVQAVNDFFASRRGSDPRAAVETTGSTPR